MLERIEEIQGIGLLHAANGKPYTCKKATLIYGDNGRGKSTLAAIMRSLSTDDPSLITHRKTVDGTVAAKVTLQFGNGHKVTFSGNKWSERRPDVLVFDADFIERNVHSGGEVNTGHRKNLLEFALGEPAVAAREAVEKATGEAKAAADKMRGLTEQLSGHHAGMTLAQFEKLPNVPDADAQQTELQKRISAAGNIATILAKVVPTAIGLPNFDATNMFAVLKTSLADVHVEAEQLVKQHVQKLGGAAAESWLSQGRQFGGGEMCPYCNQDTKDNNLIRAYQTHFNAAYAALKSKVSSLQNGVVSGTDASIVTMFAQGVATASAQAMAWSEHVQAMPIDFDEQAARIALAELQGFLLDLVRRKQASPADSLGTAEELDKATALWKKVIGLMQAANQTIKAASELIVAYKGKLTTDNIQLLQQQVLQLQAAKRRHSAAVVDLLAQLVTARATAATAEAAKKAEREKLDALMTAILLQYQKSINSLLKNFGASFSIKGMGANFKGAAPRTEYGLSIRGKDVVLEGGPPSFSTTMSEGDKRTLAFAFFVASTLADTKLTSRTVIVDDPMCSLDLNRKHHTRAVLKNLHSKAGQLIVLAHDPYFIRDLREALCKDDSATPIAMFQLTHAAGGYTDFAPLDVDKECESSYFRHHRLLNEFSAGTSGDTGVVSKAIRPMLEGYLHRRFPSLIPKSMMFGGVVVLIRDALSTNPLSYAQNLVAELNEINAYAGQFHHDTNPNADAAVVVASELKTYVERSLALVHKGTA